MLDWGVSNLVTASTMSGVVLFSNSSRNAMVPAWETRIEAAETNQIMPHLLPQSRRHRRPLDLVKRCDLSVVSRVR